MENPGGRPGRPSRPDHPPLRRHQEDCQDLSRFLGKGPWAPDTGPVAPGIADSTDDWPTRGIPGGWVGPAPLLRTTAPRLAFGRRKGEALGIPGAPDKRPRPLRR